jgi:transposase
MRRYDLREFGWRVIEPLLPNEPRAVPRVDYGRVLNGIFWMLRSGSPWRDLPERYGPSTTCCNRFRKRIYYRRIAIRYEKLGSTFLPMTKLVCIRLRLRHNKPTA